jgi:hypothetical protein
MLRYESPTLKMEAVYCSKTLATSSLLVIKTSRDRVTGQKSGRERGGSYHWLISWLLLVLGSFGPSYLFPEHREGVSGCLLDIVQQLPIVLPRHVQLKSRSIDLNVEHQPPVMASINLFVLYAMSSVATS